MSKVPILTAANQYAVGMNLPTSKDRSGKLLANFRTRSYSEADQPGNTTSPAGPYGDHQCDVPASLEASMYTAIRELVPDAAFAIFTGDVVDHALWATTQASNQWAGKL